MSERPMIGLMTTTGRVQHRYDYRLRDLVQKRDLRFPFASETLEGPERILPRELPVFKPDAIERGPGLQYRE